MRMRKLILFALVAALAAPLAACGRKGPPEPPPGADVNYPRGYPSGATPPQ
jgi:predicted small lipoprotein YifL